MTFGQCGFQHDKNELLSPWTVSREGNLNTKAKEKGFHESIWKVKKYSRKNHNTSIIIKYF